MGLQIIDLALEVPELSPRELAARFTDEKQYFVSESSVDRLLKAHNLARRRTSSVTGPPHQPLADGLHLPQDHRLGIVRSGDVVTATFDLALSASGLDRITVVYRAGKLLDRDAAMQNRIDLIKKYGGFGGRGWT